VISSLWGGGAERWTCLLANSWAEQGKEVTLLTISHGAERSYPVHPAVKVRNLGLLAVANGFFNGLSNNVWRIRVLHRAIRDSRPDIVISIMDQTNILTLLATRTLRAPVIVCEATDPSQHDISPVWRGLRRLTYGFADTLLCPTSSGLEWFRARIKVRTCAIPCLFALPADAPNGDRQHSGNAAPRTLVSMGRLVRQKGFDLLLQAFSQVAGRHPEWALTILGEGPLKNSLQNQVEECHLLERVHFAGSRRDPFPALRAADLFVFSSRSEAFGMALAEAMACGLPVVSFDCPFGPRDIIRDGVDGILVPPGDVSALAAALHRLMGDDQERARLAARAPEVVKRFSRERIMSQWQELFDRLLTRQNVA